MPPAGGFGRNQWFKMGAALRARRVADVTAGEPAVRAVLNGADDMRALQLFSELGVIYVPPDQQRRRAPLETCCMRMVDGMIRKHGLQHTTLTLRTIAESEGNQFALVADIIAAVSDVILSHRRWADLGLEWLAALDSIDLAGIRKIVKAANVLPMRVGIATLICLELEKFLGPSKIPKPPRPVSAKLPPQPPRSLSRVSDVEANVKLGTDLLALRAKAKSNRAFGRAMRTKFDVDGQLASEAAKVARLYAGRDEIITRLSWDCLVRLSSPSMPAAARQDIKTRVIAGEKIVASDIVRARGQLTSGRPQRPDQPLRMAA
jgi:hypothetical protein